MKTLHKMVTLVNYSQPLSKMEVAVLGCGKIALDMHIPALRSLGAKISWVADPNARAAKLAGQLSDTVAYQLDAKSAVTDLPIPDSYLVSVPYSARGDLIGIISKTEKGIYVEKPVALNYAEHQELVRHAKPYLQSVGYQRRNLTIVPTVQRVLHSRVFGRLERIEVATGLLGIVNSSRGFGSTPSIAEHPIADSAIHAIDWALFVSGLSNVRHQKTRSLRAARDVAEVIVQFDGDTYDSLTVSCEVQYSILLPRPQSIRFATEFAQLEIDVFSPNPLLMIRERASGKSIGRISSTLPISAGDDAISLCGRHWAAHFHALGSGIPNHTSLIGCGPSTQVLEAMLGGLYG